MEISAQIKKYRAGLGLSQEELAEKIYVTRQSVSNWETGKTYPDLQSLLRMSDLFHVSLDELIKGDVETMKKEIDQAQIKQFDHLSKVYTVLLLATILLGPVFLIRLEWWGLIPLVVLFAVTFWYACKVEKFKKANDISTYKEIVAFSEGRRLDEMETQREIGKRPYQKALAGMLCGLVTVAVGLLLSWLLR